jgi:hypothetical protein
MTGLRYVGGCLCGRIRYEATGAVTDLCTCHCESCRRATGGLAVPWGTFESTRFTITRGDLGEHRSSPDVIRGFCASCGTSLTYRHAKRAHEVDVALVTLDDPNSVAPRDHIWVQDKLRWDVIGDGLPQFPTVRTTHGSKG